MGSGDGGCQPKPLSPMAEGLRHGPVKAVLHLPAEEALRNAEASGGGGSGSASEAARVVEAASAKRKGDGWWRWRWSGTSGGDVGSDWGRRKNTIIPLRTLFSMDNNTPPHFYYHQVWW